MNSNSQSQTKMDSLMEDFKRKLPKPGGIVKGEIFSRSEKGILVDLGNHTIGIIAGKHMRDDMGTAKSVKVGDEITAMVVEEEDKDGFVVLSLRRASQERAWDFLCTAHKEGTNFEVTAGAANRGGLLLDYSGINGFIPVSQLSPENYPRVNASNTNEILQKLKEFVGKKFLVKCIGLNEETRSVVLSERDAYSDQRKKTLSKIEIGDKVKVRIVGVVNFGFFVAFDGLEGLIHISEITWDHVKNPLFYGKVGDEVYAKVTNIENEKISLSMKQLTPDPWVSVLEEFALNQVIEGNIRRVTSNGAYIELKENLSGLIPASEAPAEEDLFKFFKVGKQTKARIANISEEERKIILSLDLDAISEPPAPKEEEEEIKDDSPAEKIEEDRKDKKKTEKEVNEEEKDEDKKEEAKEIEEKEEKKAKASSTKKDTKKKEETKKESKSPSKKEDEKKKDEEDAKKS